MDSKKYYCVGPFQYGSYNGFPAGANKFRYVVDSITNGGTKVELASVIVMDTEGIKKLTVSNVLDVVYLVRKTSANRIVRDLFGLLYKFRLFLYLVQKLNEDSVLVVYHYKRPITAVLLARFFKKFKLILEVEEIYADVVKNRLLRNKEFRIFRNADAFIFPTFRLNKVVNPTNKPYVVVHGNYQRARSVAKKFSLKDGRIHLVYAGILSKSKGAITAVKTAERLSEKYYVHILGYGKPSEVEEVRRTVADVSKRTQCGLSYEGMLQGDELTSFLQGCDVGLCTQTSDATYNLTSFPSKILTYLTNGLRVVSIRIPTLEESEVGDLLQYYDADDPQAVAEAVRRLDERKVVDVETRLDELDSKFGQNLRKMIDLLEQNQTR